MKEEEMRNCSFSPETKVSKRSFHKMREIYGLKDEENEKVKVSGQISIQEFLDSQDEHSERK